MSTTPPTPENRSRERVSPIKPVRVRYRLFQEFIDEMSSNISEGGMFIATARPREPGSEFDFEFLLEDGFSLIKGHAEVVWTRRESRGPSSPAGMGVRFIEMDEKGRGLIANIVDKLRQRGRRPFDVGVDGVADESKKTTVAETAQPDAGEDGVSGRESEQTDPDAAGEGTHAESAAQNALRFALLFLAGSVAGLTIVLLVNIAFVKPRIAQLEERLETLSRLPGPAGQVVDTEVGTAVSSAQEVPEADALPEPSSARLAVDAWSRAWSEKRLEDYFGAYAPDFEPARGLTKDEWVHLRSTRLSRSSSIRVQVLLVEEVELGPDETILSFVQAYTSDTYSDRVRKVLRLVRLDDGWKILEERVVRALPG